MAVVILCMVIVVGGLLTLEDGESSYIDSVAAIQEENRGEHKEDTGKDYIKWVEFNVTCEAMRQAYQYDLDTYGKEVHLDWVDLLAYLGARYGGDFTRYEEQDLDEIAGALEKGEKTIEDLTADMQYYAYYREAYGAALNGMVGEYETESVTEESTGRDSIAEKTQDTKKASKDKEKQGKMWKKVYGLKAFHPIAKGFPYSDYDDFGVSRTYGYKRNHLGHDMMGQVGTPVIAVESGYVVNLGWNQYGGWRIGINSFDGKRYYYYAHLRQDRPYAEGLKKGDLVKAGDVIGYIGRTGYSKEENVNNIDEYHLHFGLQLIFDESQREGNNEIWISCYELVRFLYQHQSEVSRNDETKEWKRTYQIKDPAV